MWRLFLVVCELDLGGGFGGGSGGGGVSMLWFFGINKGFKGEGVGPPPFLLFV